VKRQIVEMTLNGSGVRDIARVLQVGPNTVIKELKKTATAKFHLQGISRVCGQQPGPIGPPRL
jgi:transposase-like protein